jgi:O-antigen/teichoic acid export membrane protein
MVETAILIALITGLVEAIKRASGLNPRFAPLLAIAIGMLLAMAFNRTAEYSDIILIGLVAGLASSGLYDVGTKTIANK